MSSDPTENIIRVQAGSAEAANDSLRAALGLPPRTVVVDLNDLDSIAAAAATVGARVHVAPELTNAHGVFDPLAFSSTFTNQPAGASS